MRCEAGSKTFRQIFVATIISRRVQQIIVLVVRLPQHSVCDDYVGVLISLWLSKGIFLFQDNAAPHKAAITYQKLSDLHFEVPKHSAHSPDLACSD
jgi:hypothetical protein